MAINDEVSVLVRLGEDGGIEHVEVVEGWFSPDIELLHRDRIFVANVNGGDSTDASAEYLNRVDQYWND